MSLETYTKKQIAGHLETTVRTVEDDIKWFKFKPVAHDRTTNLYSKQQYQLISEMRSHCKQGKTRDSFIYSATTEVVESEDNVSTAMPSASFAIATTEPRIRSLYDIVVASYLQNLAEDPLYNLKQLERIALHGWSVPTKLIALLVGYKKFTSRDRFFFGGFNIIKVDNPNSIVRGFEWMVTK